MNEKNMDEWKKYGWMKNEMDGWKMKRTNVIWKLCMKKWNGGMKNEMDEWAMNRINEKLNGRMKMKSNECIKWTKNWKTNVNNSLD